ncbi:MAG TPA: RNA-binding protein [Sedimenticola sp.]|nr:RNA-binding protein [Sedimenticola sp.]
MAGRWYKLSSNSIIETRGTVMGVFIGNLEAGTTTSDLLDFFEEDEGITDIEIVKRRSEQGEVRYGHILFRSQEEVDRAIRAQKEKEKDLYGSRVQVREYVHRTGRNERRASGGMPWTGRERRHSDRRCS